MTAGKGEGNDVLLLNYPKAKPRLFDPSYQNKPENKLYLFAAQEVADDFRNLKDEVSDKLRVLTGDHAILQNQLKQVALRKLELEKQRQETMLVKSIFADETLNLKKQTATMKKKLQLIQEKEKLLAAKEGKIENEFATIQDVYNVFEKKANQMEKRAQALNERKKQQDERKQQLLDEKKEIELDKKTLVEDVKKERKKMIKELKEKEKELRDELKKEKEVFLEKLDEERQVMIVRLESRETNLEAEHSELVEKDREEAKRIVRERMRLAEENEKLKRKLEKKTEKIESITDDFRMIKKECEDLLYERDLLKRDNKALEAVTNNHRAASLVASLEFEKENFKKLLKNYEKKIKKGEENSRRLQWKLDTIMKKMVHPSPSSSRRSSTQTGPLNDKKVEHFKRITVNDQPIVKTMNSALQIPVAEDSSSDVSDQERMQISIATPQEDSRQTYQLHVPYPSPNQLAESTEGKPGPEFFTFKEAGNSYDQESTVFDEPMSSPSRLVKFDEPMSSPSRLVNTGQIYKGNATAYNQRYTEIVQPTPFQVMPTNDISEADESDVPVTTDMPRKNENFKIRNFKSEYEKPSSANSSQLLLSTRSHNSQGSRGDQDHEKFHERDDGSK